MQQRCNTVATSCNIFACNIWPGFGYRLCKREVLRFAHGATALNQTTLSLHYF